MPLSMQEVFDGSIIITQNRYRRSGLGSYTPGNTRSTPNDVIQDRETMKHRIEITFFDRK